MPERIPERGEAGGGEGGGGDGDALHELFRSLASSTAGDSPRERQSRAVLLRKMLERGVSPDARDPDDKDQPTLLISAAYYADLPLVRLLLESGADVHLTDASGGTALMSAALTLSLTALSESAAAGDLPVEQGSLRRAHIQTFTANENRKHYRRVRAVFVLRRIKRALFTPFVR